MEKLLLVIALILFSFVIGIVLAKLAGIALNKMLNREGK